MTVDYFYRMDYKKGSVVNDLISDVESAITLVAIKNTDLFPECVQRSRRRNQIGILWEYPLLRAMKSYRIVEKVA